jgi:hypothetical protein
MSNKFHRKQGGAGGLRIGRGGPFSSARGYLIRLANSRLDLTLRLGVG